jgi:hypothetical protein
MDEMKLHNVENWIQNLWFYEYLYTDFKREITFSVYYFLIYSVFQLLDVVYRDETLINVIKSVTRNGRSIVLTAILAVILIYLFSILGFLFFQDDFLMDIEPVKVVIGWWPCTVVKLNYYHSTRLNL